MPSNKVATSLNIDFKTGVFPWILRNLQEENGQWKSSFKKWYFEFGFLSILVKMIFDIDFRQFKKKFILTLKMGSSCHCETERKLN